MSINISLTVTLHRWGRNSFHTKNTHTLLDRAHSSCPWPWPDCLWWWMGLPAWSSRWAPRTSTCQLLLVCIFADLCPNDLGIGGDKVGVGGKTHVTISHHDFRAVHGMLISQLNWLVSQLACLSLWIGFLLWFSFLRNILYFCSQRISYTFISKWLTILSWSISSKKLFSQKKW